MYKDTGNIGIHVSSVIDASWRVEWHAADGPRVETWDIVEPERLELIDGALVYFNPQGKIADVIGSAALIRAERVS